MTVPDGLPTLSAGAHDADAGQACVMEYVSLLAGEVWTDRPECTHPLLAHEARTANDLLLDDDRPRLVPLIGRLFGTTEDSPDLRARLRLAQARQVLRLVEPDARATALGVVERAEATLRLDGDDVAEALELLRTFPVRVGALDPAHARHHAEASRIAAFVGTPDLGAAEAWALAALTVAHRTAAADCRVDCADGPARARRMVKDLAGLVDVYDEVTGRVAPPAPVAVHQLVAALP